MTDLSIIIPTLDEADWLSGCLRSTRDAFADIPLDVERIVVDGGSKDDTREIARRRGADRVIRTARGRARQMNKAASVATGRWYLFLHADSRLTVDWAEAFDAATRTPTAPGRRAACIGGWSHIEIFCRSFSSGEQPASSRSTPSTLQRLALRWIARGINWRTTSFCSATGDQAIFVRRDVFEAVGGIPDVPILEGNRLARRLRAYSNTSPRRVAGAEGTDRGDSRGTIRILDAPVRVSARRWRQRGIIRTTWLMYAIRLADRLGVPPAWLATWWSSMSTGS